MSALKIFRNWRYAITSIVIAITVFALATWLPNFRLLSLVLSDPLLSLGEKISLPVKLLASIGTNFTVLSATYTILIAIILGINASLALYLVRKRVRALGGLSIGLVGITTGVLGIGCAACGSILATTILGTIGGASILSILPLQGSEFGIFGVLLSLSSTYLLMKHINKPLVCK
ncbi:MAG: hypothetical protein Q8L64_06095 [bacterium]|nr:hypothetical protein [bacterium]